MISKEDRRALFDYFKHRPARPLREDRAASNAHETHDGGGGGRGRGASASVGCGEAGPPAPTPTPAPCPCPAAGSPAGAAAGAAAAAASVVEVGGEKGAEGPAVGRQELNVEVPGAGGVVLAPSSGAAAGLSPSLSLVSNVGLVCRLAGKNAICMACS